MAEAEAELKSRILRLLEEDREFRLSVAGLVGFKEVLERLEEHDRRFEEQARMLNGLDLKIEALGSRWGIFSEKAFRGVKPKLAIISPFVEPDAKEETAFHGIPVFTRISLK